MKKLKKLLSVFLIIVISFGMTNIANSENNNIKVILDGQELTFDVPPQIIDGRTMVPFRNIFSKLGYLVYWEEEHQSITAFKGERIIGMWVGDGTVLRYGDVYKVITLDVPPMIVDGRTLVPIRGVAEISDCDVQWDGVTQTVTITSPAEN